MSAAKRSASRASGLTHLDRRARPTMIDVGEKPITQRSAEAEAQVLLPLAVARALKRSGHRTRKGPVFDTAIIAGIMAAKRTSELIPFCHPLMLDDCRVEIDFKPAAAGRAILSVRCRVQVQHKTGVEMEALTGATVAALTVYDMCKALSHDIQIGRVRLLSKRGGRRDFIRVKS